VAQGVGSGKIARDSQDVFGGKLYAPVDYSGPLSYVQGGDAVDTRGFGFPNVIMTLIGSIDQTGTFRLEPRPLQNGVTAWQMIWTVLSTGQEVASGTNLSKFKARLSAIGY
jgi:hypothetical protein